MISKSISMNTAKDKHVLRSFKSVKTISGKDAVSVREVLRYCFSHFEDYAACKEIVRG